MRSPFEGEDKCGCGLALVANLCRVHGANLAPQTPPDPHMAQHVVAELRRMGKRYPALEPLLETMGTAALRDLLRAIRDAKDDGKRTMRAKANRYGLGHLIR